MDPILIIVIVFLISLSVTYLLARPDSKLRILDHPNERSLHVIPTPRTGGIAIILAILLPSVIGALSFGHTDYFISIFFSALLIALISFFDDYHSISAIYRFIVHCLAAIILMYGGLIIDSFNIPGITLDWHKGIATAITLVFIVWLINLYNFMDGIDGFAGGMTIFGFGSMALIGWIMGENHFAVANLVIVAAATGFLIFNFPPARIFMGDVGSSVLGLLAATFSLWANNQKIFPLWVAILIFSPFIIDATITLIRRLLQGERVWEAHRDHYYQKLVQMGWSHAKTVIYQYILMLLCGASGLIAVFSSVVIQWMIIVIWILAYIALAVIIDKSWRARTK